MNRKHYRKHLKIDDKELLKYEKILDSENVDFDKEGIHEYSTIKKWTVRFSDGCFADLKVNSNSRADGDFFSEAVLFDANGSQLDFSECQYDLAGRWNLATRNADYAIFVEPA